MNTINRLLKVSINRKRELDLPRPRERASLELNKLESQILDLLGDNAI